MPEIAIIEIQEVHWLWRIENRIQNFVWYMCLTLKNFSWLESLSCWQVMLLNLYWTKKQTWNSHGLTHYSLVMPYGFRHCGQHWTNVDILPVGLVWTSVKFESKYRIFLQPNSIWKCLQNVHHFVQASMYEWWLYDGNECGNDITLKYIWIMPLMKNWYR